MLGSPLGSVAVDVAADLRRPRAEPAGARGVVALVSLTVQRGPALDAMVPADGQRNRLRRREEVGKSSCGFGSPRLCEFAEVGTCASWSMTTPVLLPRECGVHEACPSHLQRRIVGIGRPVGVLESRLRGEFDGPRRWDRSTLATGSTFRELRPAIVVPQPAGERFAPP